MAKSVEEFCREILSNYLETKWKSIQWEEGDEPPDYYFYVNGEKFAVEITSAHQQIVVNKESKERTTIDHSLMLFLKRTEEILLGEGILNGYYYCYLEGPISNFPKFKAQFLREIRKLISSNALDPSSGHIKLNIEGEIVEVWRDNYKVNRLVGMAGIKKHSKSIHIQHNVNVMVMGALQDKIDKLKDISCKKILVILNDYFLANISMFRTSIESIIEKSFFDEIYYIDRDKTVGSLYSQGAL